VIALDVMHKRGLESDGNENEKARDRKKERKKKRCTFARLLPEKTREREERQKTRARLSDTS
jgi:hypothetical protein